MSARHTPGPWFAGAQNDALFIVAGRPPALNNDYPWHEAPRVALCKVFGSTEDDCLPINANANARLIAAAPDMLEAIEGLANILSIAESNASGNPEWEAVSKRINAARAAIAKARGETA